VGAAPTGQSFRTLFCERFQIDDADFDRRALRYLLHFPWSTLSPFLSRRWPKLFKVDQLLMRRLGVMKCRETFFSEIRRLRDDYIREGDFGVSRKWFRRRLSSRRLLVISSRLFKT